MVESLQKIQLSNQELSRFQQAVDKFSLQFIPILILNGQLIEASVVTGSNIITHGLPQKPVGFFLAANSANVNIWGNTFEQKTLTIESTGTANIKIWVF